MIMRNKLYYFGFLFLVSFALHSQSSTAGFVSNKAECLGTELDGSMTLRSWGIGRNNSDAVEQAKKNAVAEVIFKGISVGQSVCSRSPLLIDMGAEKKHEEYFATFFSDDGPYKEFVNLNDEKIKHKIKREKKKTDVSVTKSVIVRVNRLALKKKLVADNIMLNYRD